jgi:hypothetical protein
MLLSVLMMPFSLFFLEIKIIKLQKRSILQPYVDRGIMTLVTKVDHSHDADHGQWGHRDQCIAENPSKAKWIVMVW